MRKFLSVILCAVMLFTCVSCAEEMPEIVPEYNGNVSDEKIDLGGRTLIMGMEPNAAIENEGTTLGYIPNTEFGDLASQRIRDVEKAYNCNIEFDYVSGPGERAYNSAIAGTYIFDFINQGSFSLVNYMRASAFQDLTAVENLDVFDETKWGNKNMRISTMWDGSIFGLLPAAHPMRLSNSLDEIFVINENYIAQLLETDPRDYYENGVWDWEHFEYCLYNYAHTNNANEYVYSAAASTGGFLRDLAMANGNEFMTIDENGNFELGYFTPSAIEAYHQAYEWFNGATSSYLNKDYSLETFLAGGSVLVYIASSHVLSTTNAIAYQMDNYGIIPVPYGPSAEGPMDFKSSYSSAQYTIAIPITAKDIEISALVLDAIYEPFEGYETEADVFEYLSDNYFRDERDAAFLLEMTKNDHAFYHDHLHGFTFWSDIIDSGVSKVVESKEESLYETAKKYNYSAYATLKQYEEYFHE